MQHPRSSIYKIINELKKSKKHEPWKPWKSRNYVKLNSDEQAFIKDYVSPPQVPLTIESINKKLNETFGFKNRKRDIKEYLKKELCYSYKKGGATTFKGGSQRTLFLQSTFSSRLLSKILDDKLIINVDECAF